MRAKHLSCIEVSRRVLCYAILCVAFGGPMLACASAGGSRAGSNNDALITAEEIESSHQPTLFDVVRALRPNWLRPAPTALRGDRESELAVYLDDQRAGGLDVLRQLPTTAAASLRFYGATEAQARFGNGNLHGVIQIVSARGRP